jgi:hypothetical protein
MFLAFLYVKSLDAQPPSPQRVEVPVERTEGFDGSMTMEDFDIID